MTSEKETVAGLGIRLLALCYDALILIALYLITFMIVMVPLSIELLPVWLSWAIIISITAAFYSYFWMRGGQTVGMRAWRLQIKAASDQPLSIKDCSIRIIAGALNLAIFGIGYLYALINPQKLSLLDSISGTYIVRLEKNPHSRK